MKRRGQTTTETLLLTSVVVVAVVSVGYWLAGGSSGIVAGMQSMASGATEAYVDPSRAP